MAVFQLRFSIRKEWKNRKLVERLITFPLIGLLHLQIPEPASRWTTMRGFVSHLSWNFIIAKYLKQEVDDRVSVWVGWTYPLWPLCNSRYKDLSVSRDQKVVTLLPIMEKLQPYGLLSKSCFYRPHLITVAPL